MKKFFEKNAENVKEYKELIIPEKIQNSFLTFGYITIITNIIVTLFAIGGIIVMCLYSSFFLIFLLPYNFIYNIYFKNYYIKKEEEKKRKEEKIRIEQNKINIKNWIETYSSNLNKHEDYFLFDPGSGFLEIVEKKPKDFLIKFFNRYNHMYFTSLKNKDMICGRNRRRSLFDTYLITRQYFKDLKFIEFLKIMIELFENKTINTSYCNEVCKYVFYNGRISTYNNLKSYLEFTKDFNFNDLIYYFKYQQDE